MQTEHALAGSVVGRPDPPQARGTGWIRPLAVADYNTAHSAIGRGDPDLADKLDGQAHERAAAFWPNKGEIDPRPDQSLGYASIAPVAPKRPAVPAGAPAALVLLPVPAVRGDQRQPN
ncbi:hypothetical protein ACFWM1_17380 [Nocardia sp. NPDC058379]|uniref:hypothetical protein n=1 Tax=unclassified Nocardia TaxID=2637762 RepID=UPI003652CCCB